jgi:hypothetical protein
MVESDFKDYTLGEKISPKIISFGLPPPLQSPSTITYEDRWLRLMLMELHACLAEFKEQRRSLQDFPKCALLKISITNWRNACFYDATVSGMESEGGKLNTELTPQDLPFTILYLGDDKGWVYITQVEDPNSASLAAKCVVMLFNKDFHTRLLNKTKEIRKSVPRFINSVLILLIF